MIFKELGFLHIQTKERAHFLQTETNVANKVLLTALRGTLHEKTDSLIFYCHRRCN